MFINEQTCNGFDLRGWVYDLADEAPDMDDAIYTDIVSCIVGA